MRMQRGERPLRLVHLYMSPFLYIGKRREMRAPQYPAVPAFAEIHPLQKKTKHVPGPPRGIPRPAGTPLPGPASRPVLSSPSTGGGPSTVTDTIVSPRRITRPSVRFCCTVGAASSAGAVLAFLPWQISISWSSWLIWMVCQGTSRRKRRAGTHLDCPELFALGQDKVHVLVVRQHLTD